MVPNSVTLNNKTSISIGYLIRRILTFSYIRVQRYKDLTVPCYPCNGKSTKSISISRNTINVNSVILF